MNKGVQNEIENTEKQLADLNSTSEGITSNLGVNYDIQLTLLATKKALDEDLKNLSIISVDLENVNKLSQMFDLSNVQAESILKSNRDNLNDSIKSLLLDFPEYDNAKKQYTI
ncbi:hypothetical protein FG386_000634 [Cryptosporidium ryanae]|uniref:uncharacterized protein n=1 Tax=Cryptosporidium ryanae TaxID=515981 RepID=UPI00351A014B|nr:hypothetical protein FG386_000634 [Cryptosporidium ryanae]